MEEPGKTRAPVRWCRRFHRRRALGALLGQPTCCVRVRLSAEAIEFECANSCAFLAPILGTKLSNKHFQHFSHCFEPSSVHRPHVLTDRVGSSFGLLLSFSDGGSRCAGLLNPPLKVNVHHGDP